MSTISIYVTSEDFHYLLNIDIYTVLVYWWEYERTLYLAPIFGTPLHPDELHEHRCLVMEQCGRLMNECRFEAQGEPVMVRVTPDMVCDDGALLRQWVLAGTGIASKSWWDVKRDVEQGRLILLFADSFIGFSRHDKKKVGLQFVYPQQRFQPLQVTAFSEFFIHWLDNEYSVRR